MTSMFRQRRPQAPAIPQPLRTWRVTTAVRVFVLALAVGMALSAGKLESVGVALIALCVLAAIAAAVEFDATVAMPAVPVAEAALAAIVLGYVEASTEPLVVYLIVPPLVAGLRHGIVSVLNTVLAEVLAILGMLVVAEQAESPSDQLGTAVPWVVVGLGVGLLATWLHNAARSVERTQGPYVSAHRLLTQLRMISRKLPTGLDTASIAQQLVRETQDQLYAGRVGLWLGSSPSGLLPYGAAGLEFDVAEVEASDEVRASLKDDRVQHRVLPPADPSLRHRTVLPLRPGGQAVGVVVADTPVRPDAERLSRVQVVLDDHGLRLDTAMLFDEVRALATSEERERLAREIHDGIAQEIASLGYLVDDLAAGTDAPHTRLAAAQLREELSRVVGELRLSIFDLRNGVDQSLGLGRALTDYALEVGARSDLRVHLDLQERPTRLRPEVETELLRIAQEAINNARKHAQATNLWVRLHADATTVNLRVEDDGVGGPELRDGHYGLRIMRERAERVGAQFSMTDRAEGGTTVAVHVAPTSVTTKGISDADHRASR